MIPDELRQCTYCKKQKMVSAFPRHAQNKDGIDRRCRSCINKRQKLVNELRKFVRPKPKNGLCECCGEKKPKGLVLDHDPVTEKFRGWLCQPCNMGLGCIGDSVESIHKMVLYLERAYGISFNEALKYQKPSSTYIHKEVETNLEDYF